ncbi:hypothetical protein [Gracilimonas mengyeensis]|uniref:Nuclear transport factor 2 family protein n=1 Tax=Gracilimonas mengyeensis TaxID=1302730 RepID=A0A521FL82_9BACT|nr:hypothetical protein [Gracilimonas mengyeensis]SMO96983.1 hypothetical protein SAMN06265219_1229 [Gracilimonas mengyeensis]
MKYAVLIFAALLVQPLSTQAQQKADFSADVENIDNLIEALYATISGEKGEPRQWDRFRNLFIPEARLIPTGENEDGKNTYRVMNPEEFIENTNEYFVENGFYEYELSREEHHYGRVVHLFSTYASKRSKADEEPFNKGINSIQLFNDGERWWIVTIYWAHASEANPIPEKYLD